MALQHLPRAYWPLERLKPAPWNPRTISAEAFQELVRGIETFGLLGGVDARAEDGLLLGGHQRRKAIELLLDRHRADPAKLEAMHLPGGLVPVNPILGVDDATAAQIVVRLNNEEAQGRWNVPQLTEILAELDARGHDATLTGYSEERIREMLHIADAASRKPVDDDDEFEMPVAPRSRPGRLYQLGKHRLACGDSRDPALWMRLLATGAPGGRTERADLAFTDPPYGVSYVGKAGRIKNDDLTPAQLRELLTKALTLAWMHSKPGATWYVCAPGGPLFHTFSTVLLALGVWRQTIQWIKDRFVLSRQDYHNRNEPIFAGERPDLADADLSTASAEDVVLAESIAHGWKEGAGHHRVEDRTQDNCWEIPRPQKNPDHPTMKPLELVRRALRNSSRAGQIVVDPFAGSGQTLLAADQLGRIARVIELDPRFCDVIRRRYAERTGQPEYAPDHPSQIALDEEHDAAESPEPAQNGAQVPS